MDKSIPAPAAMILDYIGGIEAPKGYDTVYGNRMGQMPKPLTKMTMAEILNQGKWRTNTFGSSACGRYQFMDATLRDLAAQLDLQADDVFTPAYQDRLGMVLLRRRKYDEWVRGLITHDAFMWELAKEWASFPVPEDGRGAHRQVKRGETYYAGDKLNKSLVKPEAVWNTLEAARKLNGIPAPDLGPPPVEQMFTRAEMEEAVTMAIKNYQAATQVETMVVLRIKGGQLVEAFQTDADGNRLG